MPCPPPIENVYQLVSIQKTKSSDKFGVVLIATGARLIVKKIFDDTLVSKWNKDHPDMAIEEGDHIVDVNGVSGCAWKMRDLCSHREVTSFEIVVCRAAKVKQLYTAAADRMRFRNLIPEDYKLLELVDEAFPSKTSLTYTAVARLSRVNVKRCSEYQCSICLSEYVKDERVTQLPCEHSFCTKCISQWLTESKNKCPQCQASVVCPNSDSIQDASRDDLESEISFESVDLSCSAFARRKASSPYFEILSATRCGGLGRRLPVLLD